MSERNRPLSPHLGIYRWQVSNSMSILHRLTGVFMALGSIVLVGWLVAIAAGEAAYSRYLEFLSGVPGGLLLFGFSAGFFYHLINGVRHLAWDAGYGFGREVARMSGWLALILAVLATALFWWGVFA